MAWLYNKRTDSQISTHRTALIEGHRRAAAVAIKAIQWLAKEMVALRGHNSNQGKFLSLYTLLADFEPAAKVYLDQLCKIRSNTLRSKPDVNILSPRNVRRLLEVMKMKTVH